LARRKTNEEFVKEVYDLVGDEYTFLEEYIDNKTKIKCQHNKCKHEWGVRPNQFLSGHGCPICNKGSQGQGGKNQLSYNEVKQYIENTSDSMCKLLSTKYTKSINKLKIQCECGHVFYQSFTNFKASKHKKCPKCINKRRQTGRLLDIDEIKGRLTKLNPDILILDNAYISSRTKLNCKCLIDGYKWRSTWNDLQQGKGCPMCAGNARYTKERVENIVEQYNIQIIKYIDNEINANTEILCNCKCGREFKTKIQYLKSKHQCDVCSGYKYDAKYIAKNIPKQCKFIKRLQEKNMGLFQCGCGRRYKAGISEVINRNKHQCNICSKKPRKDTDFFKKELYSIYGDKYTVEGKYIKAHQHVKIKCNLCKHTFHTKPTNILSGYECPICNIPQRSKGESTIFDFLYNNNINYVHQYSFENSLLRFDFAVFDSNHVLIGLIEFDGIQHFEPVDFFGGQDQFEYQQQNDQIKNQYCKDNNIPLLRIPYWEFDNIETILEEWLTEHGVLNQ
jgi:hypothetical protein